jgi:integrase
MRLRIEELTEGVMRKIESIDYSKMTIKACRTEYDAIIRWFNTENDGFYDLRTWESYLAKFQSLLDMQSISRPRFQRVKCHLTRLRKYAETGVVDLSREPTKRLYNPSAESLDFIDSTLSLCFSSLSESSKRVYHMIMRRFFCFIESKEISVNEITLDVMIDFIHHVRENYCGSMRQVVRCLNMVADHLISLGLISQKPNIACFKPKAPGKKIIPAYTMSEVSSILQTFDRATSAGKRNYAIILLSCGTGLRACDVIKMERSDIDWKSGEISICQKKTKRPLTVVINGQIRNALADYILNGRPRSDSKNVFLSINSPHVPLNCHATLSRIIERACELANVKKKSRRSFHSLRRSFATWLAGGGTSVYTIFQMLGQAEVESSVPYVSFDDTQIASCAMGFDDIPVKNSISFYDHPMLPCAMGFGDIPLKGGAYA